MSLHLDYTHLDASPPRSCRAFASPPPPYAANPPPIAHAVWHDVVASARAHRVMADPTNPASPDFAAVRRRLHQELAAMERESVPGICVGVVGGNLFEWWGSIQGPANTPFQGGTFQLHIALPPLYPFRAPSIRFTTRMFHPNIDADGNISCNVLGVDFTPALTAQTLLLSIQSLLDDPFGEERHAGQVECLVPQVGALYWARREVYEEMVRVWVGRYAMASGP